jgi:uncharacterized membrane protein YfhO
MATARDFSAEAWIEDGARETSANGPGAVRVERRGTKLELSASMAGGGWVIASEPAWRGWRAIENGNELTIHNADQTFIAFYLPQGEHRVTLEYRPQSFMRGAWISASTLAAIAAVIIGGLHARATRRRELLVPELEPAA